MARRKGKGYQTLLKEFVLERLYEEEKRKGSFRAKGLLQDLCFTRPRPFLPEGLS